VHQQYHHGVVVIRVSRRLIAGAAMVDFYGDATGSPSPPVHIEIYC
jgi:hypothetical protein